MLPVLHRTCSVGRLRLGFGSALVSASFSSLTFSLSFTSVSFFSTPASSPFSLIFLSSSADVLSRVSDINNNFLAESRTFEPKS
jgi:hypothetical protein